MSMVMTRVFHPQGKYMIMINGNEKSFFEVFENKIYGNYSIVVIRHENSFMVNLVNSHDL